jgi:3-oxoacyl-[acyl-carrier protein] reductase
MVTEDGLAAQVKFWSNDGRRIMNTSRFSGKVAIVTGAGRGMGKATALTLARDGAAVVVNDINPKLAEAVAKEIEAAGGQVLAYVADVSDEAQVQAMVDATVERFGTVDILVNNAGILRSTSPLETIPLEEWELIMTVNVTGVFLCTKAVLPIMKAKRSGKIVNISSSAGRSTSTFGGAHYTTSKAAVLGLSRHTAREAAPYNVNVNAVAPGSMDTEMVRELATPEHMERERQGIPLHRLGTAQDEANLVAFLCSEESSYIAGATIDINGGDLII